MKSSPIFTVRATFADITAEDYAIFRVLVSGMGRDDSPVLELGVSSLQIDGGGMPFAWGPARPVAEAAPTLPKWTYHVFVVRSVMSELIDMRFGGRTYCATALELSARVSELLERGADRELIRISIA